MKLGILALNLRGGGGIRHLSQLLSAAEPNDFGVRQVTLWCGPRLERQIPKRSWLKTVCHPRFESSALYRLYWERVRLPRLAKAECDLLFVPGGSYWGTFRPYATMFRNLLPFDPSEARRFRFSLFGLKLRALRLNQIRSFRSARGLIFLGEYPRSVVLRHLTGFQGESRIIAHGVDERFRKQPNEQLPISRYTLQDPFKILYVSTINAYKHQWVAVEAVHRLRSQGLPVVLELVGSAQPGALARLEAALRRFDPHGAFVHYHGSLPGDQIHRIYHSADCFLFASTCENMPNILIEAMASGLPIACSDREPMPGVLGQEGVFFDPESPDAMACALGELLSSPDKRHQAAWAAYRRASELSWERCAKETFQFLSQLIQAGFKSTAPSATIS